MASLAPVSISHGKSKSIHMPRESSRNTGRTFDAIATSAPLPATSSGQQTLFAEGFPVNLTVSPALAEVPATSAISGPTSPESFAKFDPDGSWRKTSQGYSQVTLDGSLERFSETWPRAGMTRNGTAYRLVPSAPLTGEIASGLWRTPGANDGPRGAQDGLQRLAGGHCLTLRDQVITPSLWPTPTTQDASNNGGSSQYDRNSLPLNAVVGGSLNPTWVEWLMGYPLEWTACAGSATRSCRRSRNGSRIASEK